MELRICVVQKQDALTALTALTRSIGEVVDGAVRDSFGAGNLNVLSKRRGWQNMVEQLFCGRSVIGVMSAKTRIVRTWPR
jgi:hypothetical protein